MVEMATLLFKDVNRPLNFLTAPDYNRVIRLKLNRNFWFPTTLKTDLFNVALLTRKNYRK